MRPKFNFLAASKIKAVPQINNNNNNETEEKLNNFEENVFENPKNINKNDEIFENSAKIIEFGLAGFSESPNNDEGHQRMLNEETLQSSLKEGMTQKVAAKKNRLNIKNAVLKPPSTATILSEFVEKCDKNGAESSENNDSLTITANKSIISIKSQYLKESSRDSVTEELRESAGTAGRECLGDKGGERAEKAVEEATEKALEEAGTAARDRGTVESEYSDEEGGESAEKTVDEATENDGIPAMNRGTVESEYLGKESEIGKNVEESALNLQNESLNLSGLMTFTSAIIDEIDKEVPAMEELNSSVSSKIRDTSGIENNIRHAVCNDIIRKKVGKKLNIKNAVFKPKTQTLYNTDIDLENANNLNVVITTTDSVVHKNVLSNLETNNVDNTMESTESTSKNINCESNLSSPLKKHEDTLTNKIGKRNIFNLKNAKSKSKNEIINVEETENKMINEVPVSQSIDNIIKNSAVDEGNDETKGFSETHNKKKSVDKHLIMVSILEKENAMYLQDITDINHISDEPIESKISGINSFIDVPLSDVNVESKISLNKLTEDKNMSPKHKFNVKNALTKDTFKSPIKVVPANIQHSVETVDIDTASVASMSSSRKSKSFVLKKMSLVAVDDTIDRSKVSLKSIINLTATQPPPKFRSDRKNKKNNKKIDDVPRKENVCQNIENLHTTKLRIDLDGNIVFDFDKSNVECTPFSSEGMEVVVEDARYLKATYKSFTKRNLSGKRWTKIETDNFYKALLVVGTNFYAMESIFEGRSRNDLKKKFKVEEKLHPEHVNYILMNPQPFNLETIKFDSHLKVTKSRKDAVKRILKCSYSDTEEYIPAPKKRKFSIDPVKNGLNLADGDLPSYF